MTDDQDNRRKGAHKMNLQSAGILLGILISVGGFVGTWTTMSYRVGAAEGEITVLKTKRDTDHEALVRIEEQVREVRRLLEVRKP